MGIWETPDGYALKDLMDKWNEVRIREDKYNSIHMLVDGQNFVLFFEYNDKVYGTTEQHRVTFAKMKDPDDDTSDAWVEEAKFMAFNLSDAIGGKPAQEIFYQSDIDDINIVKKEDVLELLKHMADQESPQAVSSGAQAIAHFVKQFGGPKEPQKEPGTTGIPMNQGEK